MRGGDVAGRVGFIKHTAGELPTIGTVSVQGDEYGMRFVGF